MGMNLRTRTQIAVDLMQAHGLKPAFVAEVAKLRDDLCEDVEWKRNLVIHGNWVRMYGRWYIMRTSGSRAIDADLVSDTSPSPQVRVRRAVIADPVPLGVSHVRSIARTIVRCRKRVVGLRKRIEAALPPSPHKSPAQIRPSHRSRVHSR